MSDLLTKDAAIMELRDPRGWKWGVVREKQTGLCEIAIIEGNKTGVLPKQLTGKYTNITLATKALKGYLNTAWEESDEQARKLARKAGRDDLKE